MDKAIYRKPTRTMSRQIEIKFKQNPNRLKTNLNEIPSQILVKYWPLLSPSESHTNPSTTSNKFLVCKNLIRDD